MNTKNINDDTLLEIGFEKLFAHRDDGFYILYVNDKLYLTIDFKTMMVSIQLKGYGHIQKLEHIKTINQISDLFFCFNWKTY